MTNLNLWKKILSVIGSQIEVLTFSLTLFPDVKSIIISSSYSLSDEKACQRSPFGAKMWNSHIFLSFIMLI
jgi:hypothetical protein